MDNKIIIIKQKYFQLKMNIIFLKLFMKKSECNDEDRKELLETIEKQKNEFNNLIKEIISNIGKYEIIKIIDKVDKDINNYSISLGTEMHNNFIDKI